MVMSYQERAKRLLEQLQSKWDENTCVKSRLIKIGEEIV